MDDSVVDEIEEEADAQERCIRKEAKKRLQQKVKVGHIVRSDTRVLDDENASCCKKMAFKILTHRLFDPIIGVVIFANTVIIGLETDLSMDVDKFLKYEAYLDYAEYIFLTTYTVELTLRFIVDRLKALKSGWVLMDLFIVLGSGVDIMIKIFLNTSEREGGDVVQLMMVMRIGRVFRLVRSMRLFTQFRTLWALIRGLIGCTLAILHSCLVLALLLYVSSIVALELIAKPIVLFPDASEQALLEHVRRYFIDLQTTLLSLSMFIFKGHSLYELMIQEQPASIFYWTIVMAVLFIGMMNMITATIVQKYTKMAEQDHETEMNYLMQGRAKVIPSLEKLFNQIDTDGSGSIELQEIIDAPVEVHAKLQQIMRLDDVHKIFALFDVDDSGEVMIDEFIDGLLRLVEGGTKEQLKVEKLLESVHHRLDELILDHKRLFEITRQQKNQQRAEFGRGCDGRKIGQQIHPPSSR
jgi:hypothetical protein